MTDNTGGNNSANGGSPDGAVAGPSRSATTESSNANRPNAAYSFPPAFQPSIIRSFQKDAYYLSLFKAQFIDVARTVIGSRALQTHSDKLALVAAIAYHVFTTWEGAQTLGEEYVGSRMVARPRNGGTSRFVSRSRRVAFILTQVLLPFVLSRFYAAARRRINVSHQLRSQALQRAQMRARAVQSEEDKGDASKAPHPSRLDRIVGGLSRTLPSLEDLNRADGWLSYATAIHLMLFYLGGKYYKIAQRLVRVRYVSSLEDRQNLSRSSAENCLLPVCALDLHPSVASRSRATFVRGPRCSSGRSTWCQVCSVAQSLSPSTSSGKERSFRRPRRRPGSVARSSQSRS